MKSRNAPSFLFIVLLFGKTAYTFPGSTLSAALSYFCIAVITLLAIEPQDPVLEFPSEVKAPIQTTAIRAAISAYSIDVAPLSLRLSPRNCGVSLAKCAVVISGLTS
jgi:hypothetical protein